MQTKLDLFTKNDAQIAELLTDFGQPKFRTKQIKEWLMRGADIGSACGQLRNC
jgi:adenine C2-methylase RlmN of 23S rRNA A2503 and tRNA A37